MLANRGNQQVSTRAFSIIGSPSETRQSLRRPSRGMLLRRYDRPRRNVGSARPGASRILHHTHRTLQRRVGTPRPPRRNHAPSRASQTSRYPHSYGRARYIAPSCRPSLDAGTRWRTARMPPYNDDRLRCRRGNQDVAWDGWVLGLRFNTLLTRGTSGTHDHLSWRPQAGQWGLMRKENPGAGRRTSPTCPALLCERTPPAAPGIEIASPRPLNSRNP